MKLAILHFLSCGLSSGCLTADLLLNRAIIVEANRKFMQFLKRRAAFEGYQRIAENDIIESKRKKL